MMWRLGHIEEGVFFESWGENVLKWWKVKVTEEASDSRFILVDQPKGQGLDQVCFDIDIKELNIYGFPKMLT